MSVPSSPAGESNAAANSSAELAAQQLAPNAPPVAIESRPEFGHLTVPILAGAEAVDPSAAGVPVAPQSEEPPLAQDEGPIAIPQSTAPAATPPILVTTAPLPGLLSFNLAAIESGVRGVIAGVTDLEHTLAETDASTADYLWLAAAALVAGGAAQSAWTRRSRSADPRTLGLDSVLARWGEKYVG